MRTRTRVPVLATNEYTLANYIIDVFINNHNQLINADDLNNVLALLEGYSQTFWRRPLLNYNKYFTVNKHHYVLPNISTGKLTNMPNNHFVGIDSNLNEIVYPELTPEMITINKNVFSKINDLIVHLARSNRGFIDDQIGLAVGDNFVERVAPNDLAYAYLNYIYAEKIAKYGAPLVPTGCDYDDE